MMGRVTEERRTNKSLDVLEVRLGDVVVGSIARLQNDANIFTFSPDYLDDLKRPTLSLGFKGPGGTLVERGRPTKVKLHPFFSNLLPEGHLRDYLAQRGGIHEEREFFLIWLLGADLPGAVTVTGVSASLPPREQATTTPDERAVEQPLRFSLAGVQLKFSALMETSSGLTLPVGGIGGDWIAKLPSARYAAVPEAEYAFMTLAAAVGIDVPEVRLIKTDEIANLPSNLPEAFGQTFAIKRFDRTPAGDRIHIEDFAQVFGLYPHHKYRRASYGNIARVLWLETGEDGIIEFVRRLAFNVLIGNADAHLKNWSLIYLDGRTPSLSPAYDLLPTIAYIPNDTLALSIAGTKAFKEIDAERFRRFAEKAELPTRLVVKTATEVAQNVRDIWSKHDAIRDLPADLRRSVEAHMKVIPL